MSDKAAIVYLNLWKDICFYEVYMDIIAYEKYLIYLSNKYCTDIDTINITIDEVKREAIKRIKEHHEKEKEYQPLFKTECEEETIKTVIEYNRKREEIKESIFDESSLTINEIKKLGLFKTRK